jgi:hypothetical protein
MLTLKMFSTVDYTLRDVATKQVGLNGNASDLHSTGAWL